jgi:hypothetical protein
MLEAEAPAGPTSPQDALCKFGVGVYQKAPTHIHSHVCMICCLALSSSCLPLRVLVTGCKFREPPSVYCHNFHNG